MQECEEEEENQDNEIIQKNKKERKVAEDTRLKLMESLAESKAWKRASLKVAPTTFLLVCFLSLNESTCQNRKNVFYFTSEALFVLEKIRF